MFAAVFHSHKCSVISLLIYTLCVLLHACFVSLHNSNFLLHWHLLTVCIIAETINSWFSCVCAWLQMLTKNMVAWEQYWLSRLEIGHTLCFNCDSILMISVQFVWSFSPLFEGFSGVSQRIWGIGSWSCHQWTLTLHRETWNFCMFLCLLMLCPELLN